MSPLLEAKPRLQRMALLLLRSIYRDPRRFYPKSSPETLADTTSLKSVQAALVWTLENRLRAATGANRGSTQLQSSRIPRSASRAQLFDPTVTSCSQESLTAAQGITQREEIATGLGYAQLFPTEKQFAMEKE